MVTVRGQLVPWEKWPDGEKMLGWWQSASRERRGAGNKHTLPGLSLSDLPPPGPAPSSFRDTMIQSPCRHLRYLGDVLYLSHQILFTLSPWPHIQFKDYERDEQERSWEPLGSKNPALCRGSRGTAGMGQGQKNSAEKWVKWGRNQAKTVSENLL